MGGSIELPMVSRFSPAVGRCRPAPQKGLISVVDSPWERFRAAWSFLPFWYLRASYGPFERRQWQLYRRTACPSVAVGVAVGQRRFHYAGDGLLPATAGRHQSGRLVAPALPSGQLVNRRSRSASS